MTRDELADATGASDEDIAAVRSFAGEYGLEVTSVEKGRRAVSLRGTVQSVAEAFGAQGLQLFEHPTEGKYRGRSGPLTVPSELGNVITGVFGIDERPQARAHLRKSAAPAQSYTPPEVAAAYNYPSSVNGSGQTAAILELGGGFSQTDLNTYFKGLGLTPPSVTAVSVDGGSNSPGTDPDSDGEVMLDIEVLGLRRAGCQDRRLLRAEYRPGLHRRSFDRGARHHEQAVGRLDQLGRSGGFLDATGPHADGTDPHRGSRGRRDGHRGVG